MFLGEFKKKSTICNCIMGILRFFKSLFGQKEEGDEQKDFFEKQHARINHEDRKWLQTTRLFGKKRLIQFLHIYLENKQHFIDQMKRAYLCEDLKEIGPFLRDALQAMSLMSDNLTRISHLFQERGGNDRQISLHERMLRALSYKIRKRANRIERVLRRNGGPFHRNTESWSDSNKENVVRLLNDTFSMERKYLDDVFAA